MRDGQATCLHAAGGFSGEKTQKKNPDLEIGIADLNLSFSLGLYFLSLVCVRLEESITSVCSPFSFCYIMLTDMISYCQKNNRGGIVEVE